MKKKQKFKIEKFQAQQLTSKATLKLKAGTATDDLWKWG